MKKNNRIVIGAGGTGGHLFPASSIKKALRNLKAITLRFKMQLTL